MMVIPCRLTLLASSFGEPLMAQYRKIVKSDPCGELEAAEYLLDLQRSYSEFEFPGLFDSEDEYLTDEEAVSADEKTVASENIDSCEKDAGLDFEDKELSDGDFDFGR